MSVSAPVHRLAKTAAGLAVTAAARRQCAVEPVDILFLHTYEGEVARAAPLAAATRRHGLTVRQEVIPSLRVRLWRRQLARAPQGLRWSERAHAFYAEYLVRRFQPRVVVTFDTNGLSIPLRRQANRAGARSVQIAHGVIGDSEMFRIFDFDYYFVFGQSSVDAVLRQKARIGSTKLVASGSFLIDENFCLPPTHERSRVLFLSSWLHPAVREILLRNFQALAEWARTRAGLTLVVKPHPLEDVSILRDVLAGAPDVHFLDKQTDMRTAIAACALAITGWSVASIEAAILNRPAVVLNDSDNADFLELESYYLPRARNAQELQQRIDDTFADYARFLDAADRLVRRHYDRTTDSIPFLARCLEEIARGTESFAYHAVEGTEVPSCVA